MVHKNCFRANNRSGISILDLFIIFEEYGENKRSKST